MPRSTPHKSRSGVTPWWLILLLIAAIAGGFYWWQRENLEPYLQMWPPTPATGPSDMPETGGSGSAQAPGSGLASGGDQAVQQGQPGQQSEASAELDPARDASVAADLADSGKAADAPRHPLPPGVALEGDPALPPLAASDEPILEALSGIVDRRELGRFGNIGEFTRRFVVTVDNLPREVVPAQYSAVQRIPGPLAVDPANGRITLSPENFARYDAFTGFAEQLGAKNLVSLYLRFYPLLQQEYRAMGYPKGHFHDRVIEAIDDMLSAPRPEGPIVLVQPRVHYEFADPKLQRLSAGRKLMIRVGPDNAARLQKVLREIRAELVR